MTPRNTTFASILAISLVGGSFLAQLTGPDNAPSPNGELSSIDNRTTTEIYAEYFPAPDADGADDVAPRLHRNLQTNPVFATNRRSPIDVQRKLSAAHKVNPTKRSAGVTAQRSPKRSHRPASVAITANHRANQKLSMFDLARRSFQNVRQNRAKNTVRNKQREVRLERAKRDRRRAQTRTFYRTNVRERTRLGGTRNTRGSRQTLSRRR